MIDMKSTTTLAELKKKIGAEKDTNTGTLEFKETPETKKFDRLEISRNKTRRVMSEVLQCSINIE